MSSLALQILYRAFNHRPDVVCERVFWERTLAAVRRRSAWNGMPVAVFDVWAFTVSFEMDYFNVTAMLRRSGVPPLAEERQDDRRGGDRPGSSDSGLAPVIAAGRREHESRADGALLRRHHHR